MIDRLFDYCFVEFGMQKFEEVETTSVECQVLPGVECYGDKFFIKYDVPCLRSAEDPIAPPTFHNFSFSLFFSFFNAVGIREYISQPFCFSPCFWVY